MRIQFEAFLKRFAPRSQTRSSFAPRKNVYLNVEAMGMGWNGRGPCVGAWGRARGPGLQYSSAAYSVLEYYTKGNKVKIGNISMCYVPIARECVARFTRAIPQSASTASYNYYAKIGLSKSHHGPKLWASQNIFAGHYLLDFQIWPYPS